MRIAQASRRGLSVLVAGGLGAGLMATAGMGSADAATLNLNYTCTFPLINQQSVAVNMDVAVPATIPAGTASAPFDIKAIASLNANTTSGLSLIGAKTIEGSATAHAALQAPDVSLPNLGVPVSVAKTAVPTSGGFDVVATGQTPSITFPTAGAGTIDVGNLDLVIIARNSSGTPIILPGANPDGSFNAPCTPDAGQSLRLTTFTVTPPVPANTPPTADPVTASTDAGRAVTVTLKGADADGDALTYTAGDAAHGTVSIAGDKATYTPADGFTGSDEFSYTVSDGKADATSKVSVTVNKVNTPPTADPVAATTDAGTAVTVTLKGADADGDALTYTAGDAAHGTVSIAGDQATYTPADGFTGSDEFSYTVSDGKADATSKVSVTVNQVTPANTPPTADPVTATTDAGKAVTVTLKGADADGDALTYTAGDAAHGTVTVDGDQATYTPADGFTGSDEFSYTVSDGKADATAKVSVTVNDPAATAYWTAVWKEYWTKYWAQYWADYWAQYWTNYWTNYWNHIYGG
ncbi:Ig-like domain-containing protein [Nocardioides ultimimeridianus]